MSSTNKPSFEQQEAFEGERLDSAEHATSGECMRELSRRDLDRLQLRALLMVGNASAACGPVGNAYFEGLRQRVRAAR